jgi:hypothetical protein
MKVVIKLRDTWLIVNSAGCIQHVKNLPDNYDPCNVVDLSTNDYFAYSHSGFLSIGDRLDSLQVFFNSHLPVPNP